MGRIWCEILLFTKNNLLNADATVFFIGLQKILMRAIKISVIFIQIAPRGVAK